MAPVFDQILMAVPDMARAMTDYALLLGEPPQFLEDGRPRWLLRNTCLVLEEQALGRPGSDPAACGAIVGFTLADSDLHPMEDDQALENDLGLPLARGSGAQTAALLEQSGQRRSDLAVDHIVLRSNDAQACIDLFAVRLGLRLALDQTVEAWGGRMLFFRSGKLTLEVIVSEEYDTHSFWGIAFECANLAAMHRNLQQRGISLSEQREGRKPGTKVATVKSHCLGIPTLLLQPAPKR